MNFSLNESDQVTHFLCNFINFHSLKAGILQKIYYLGVLLFGVIGKIREKVKIVAPLKDWCTWASLIRKIHAWPFGREIGNFFTGQRPEKTIASLFLASALLRVVSQLLTGQSLNWNFWNTLYGFFQTKISFVSLFPNIPSSGSHAFSWRCKRTIARSTRTFNEKD